MLFIILDDSAVEPTAAAGPGGIGAVRTDRLRFKQGSTEFTISAIAGGFTVSKVDQSNPLLESVVIQPIHTNKIKIS